MTDEKPRNKLTLKRKPKPDTNAASDDEQPATAITRGKKRRVVIEQPKPKAGPRKPTQAKKKKPKKPPSTLRLNALDAELGKLSKAWRSHKPLALGIEREVFKAIADGQLSASKRVVRALLRKHCSNPNYLRNTVVGARYDLTDQPSGEVVPSEAAYSLKVLRQLTD